MVDIVAPVVVGADWVDYRLVKLLGWRIVFLGWWDRW